MAKIRITCDDCETWYCADGVWTYAPESAAIVTIAEARAIVSSLNATARRYACIVIV